MSATYNPKTNLWSGLMTLAFALPLGIIVMLLASTTILASLIMILTPIGMMLAPTWSVQLFHWKFETALDAWYLPIFGILFGFCIFHLIKWTVRNITRFASQFLS
jgi:hypothetical protein